MKAFPLPFLPRSLHGPARPSPAAEAKEQPVVIEVKETKNK